MSSVNMDAISDSLRITALDHHRGYVQNHFSEVKQARDTDYVPHDRAAGYQILREPQWNKGMLPFP